MVERRSLAGVLPLCHVTNYVCVCVCRCVVPALAAVARVCSLCSSSPQLSAYISHMADSTSSQDWICVDRPAATRLTHASVSSITHFSTVSIGTACNSTVYEMVRCPSVCLSQHGPTAANLAEEVFVDCCSCSGRMWAVPHCQRT